MRGPATLLDCLELLAAEHYMREVQSCVGLCRESACLPGSSYQPMLLTLLAKQVGRRNGTGMGKGRTRLHHAAQTGNVARVRTLVRAGAKTDACEGMLSTPLVRACFHGHEEAARLLLDLGARAARRNTRGRTALWYASAHGHIAVIRMLVERGACVDAADNHGGDRESPLMIACSQGQEEAARLLLDLGASHARRNAHGRTALWYATRRGHISALRQLAERGADVDAVDSEGLSPLMIACREGKRDAVCALLELGASSHALRDNKGRTVLWLAAMSGHASIVRQLAERGADIKAVDNDGKSPLIAAFDEGEEETALTLLNLGAGSALTDGESRSALWRAATRSLNFVARRPAAGRGADVDAVDLNGETPLIVACCQGKEAAAQALLDLGAIHSLREGMGRTALWCAANRGYASLVRLLAGRGADVDATDDNDESPLVIASFMGKEAAAQTLLDLGASHALRDRFGRTALWYAAFSGHTSIVRLLVTDGGAEVDAVDRNGETPLMVACRMGRKVAAQVLLDLGAADGLAGDPEKAARVRRAEQSARERGLAALAYDILAKIPPA